MLGAEWGELREALAGLADGEGISVEDELVVSADGVAVRDGDAVCAGAGAEHFEAAAGLAYFEGRGAEVEDHFCALRCERGERVAVVELAREVFAAPDVLADRYAAADAGDFEGLVFFGGLKVARFVEDIIRRQERLEDFADRLPSLEDRGGVAEGASGAGVHVHVADEERDVADLCVQCVERGEVLRDEAAFEKEVERRVAGQREFRCEDDVCAVFFQRRICGEEGRGVGGEIADGGINLCEADLHGRIDTTSGRRAMATVSLRRSQRIPKSDLVVREWCGLSP